MTPNDQVTIEPPAAAADRGAATQRGRPGSEGVRRVVVASTELVVKRGTGRDRARLRHEADLLDRLRGAKVVEVVELREHDEDTELVLADAGPRTIAELDLGSPELALRALQRAAEAVADLHQRGWSHGAICAEHAVVNQRGNVRLCSLGSARPVGSEPHDFDDDLSSLIAVVEHVRRSPVEPHGVADTIRRRATSRRLARLVEHARRLHSRGELDAATLARDLRALRRRTSIGDDVIRPGLRPRTVVLGVALVVALTAIMFSRVAPESPATAASTAPASAAGPTTRVSPNSSVSPSASVSPSTVAGCAGPTVDVDGDGCDDTVRVDGEVVEVGGARYALGIVGDTAVVGDWDCDGVATARVLRGTTGEVFEFRKWATADADEVGEHVATVDGAVGAVRGDDPTEIGCDVLYVIGPDGRKERV